MGYFLSLPSFGCENTLEINKKGHFYYPKIFEDHWYMQGNLPEINSFVSCPKVERFISSVYSIWDIQL